MALEMYKDGHLGGYIKGGDPQTFCPHLWRWAIEAFQVKSVLDVGCGEGHSTKFFKDSGCDILGIEGASKAVKDNVVPGDVKQHDFCKGAFLSSQKFDMVWCCEFVEHVEERYLQNILQTFALSEKIILMTHADLRQKDGYHHVNCQESDYWIKKVEALGFVCHQKMTYEARIVSLEDYPGVNHFSRSGLVFVRPGVDSVKKSFLPAFLKSYLLEWSFKSSREYRERRKQMRLRKLQKKRENNRS